MVSGRVVVSAIEMKNENGAPPRRAAASGVDPTWIDATDDAVLTTIVVTGSASPGVVRHTCRSHPPARNRRSIKAFTCSADDGVEKYAITPDEDTAL